MMEPQMIAVPDEGANGDFVGTLPPIVRVSGRARLVGRADEAPAAEYQVDPDAWASLAAAAGATPVEF